MNRAPLMTAGLALCLAAPLSAQQKPNLDGERILAGFAQCAVRAAPREVEAVISTVPGGEDEKNRLELLVRQHGECLKFGPSLQDRQLAAEVNLGRTGLVQAAAQAANQQRQMNFSHQALRGAIAQRLYLDLPRTSPVFSPSVGDHGGSLSAGYGGSLPAGYVVVQCAVAKDPNSADRLVRSKRLSAQEADAGRAFAPALNACARDKGHIEMSGTAIHGWAAEALYNQRRSVATAGAR